MILLEVSRQQLYDASVLTLFGMGVVFAAMIALYLFFKFVPKLNEFRIKRQLSKEGKAISIENLSMEADLNAVLAAAVYLYLSELHDDESHHITIKKISRDYSPWSSKIYGLHLWNN